MNVTEVAALLGVSRATVYALIATGDLPHVRVCNAIRVRPSEAEKFVDRGGKQ